MLLLNLNWSLKLEILNYLNINEVYLFGCCNKLTFLIFLREIQARKYNNNNKKKRFLNIFYKRDSISITSYPRCGNSFLRNLIENWSNIITGADSHPCRTLSASLLRCGYKGEGITDSSVWFIKTHYPERHGYKIYGVDRAILVIRNPFDAIQSYFHMAMTNTHDKSLTPEVFHSLSHIWHPFLLHEIQIYTQFYLWWFRRSIQYQSENTIQIKNDSEQNAVEENSVKIPILLVRYEDILLKQEATMKEISEFVLSGNPPIGVNFSSFDFQSQQSSVGYTPRMKKALPGSSLQTLYTSELIQQIVESSREVLELAGYQIISDEINQTINDETESVRTSNYTLQLVPPMFPKYNSTSVSTDSTNKNVSNNNNNNNNDNNSNNKLYMNKSFSIRNSNDPYGRNVTILRKSLTKDDLEPFDTIK